jgi:hypothetical protein
MEVKWAIDAKNDYHNALDYWYEHNGSFTYSAKIIQAVEALEYAWLTTLLCREI